MTDLFGNGQHSLFGDDNDRIPHPKAQEHTPDPERIRQRLHAVLETARAAPTTPWPEKKQRLWQIVFPNMANWLPEDEANQLRFEFARELERLQKAA
ncbi:MAG: hypothetical protein QOD42_1750 [Sphingomonadales bacterium]|jgi:hypothetical protein|nr:hypothetical protein [Sphingomonadales bacterium]